MNDCSETSRSQIEELPTSLHVGSVPIHEVSERSGRVESAREREKRENEPSRFRVLINLV